ncbi:MAG: helix-turn-helix domain-containing protein [Nanoarchaeota archaeon]|nr:helix-turn-helix domain-containing protein [Nanoarchaeota archaeon]MBU1050972.1 helix-turn-helix domain-containing protein [Nanoarchaeota archaeon]MBU1989028.1 helix-turn-helix domain-containing protein [Nanoarchaeota archaeon]
MKYRNDTKENAGELTYLAREACRLKLELIAKEVLPLMNSYKELRNLEAELNNLYYREYDKKSPSRSELPPTQDLDLDLVRKLYKSSRTLGEFLKSYREKTGLCQTEFAKILRVADNTIHNLENNIGVPRERTLRKIRTATGLDYDTIQAKAANVKE